MKRYFSWEEYRILRKAFEVINAIENTVGVHLAKLKLRDQCEIEFGDKGVCVTLPEGTECGVKGKIY